MEPMTDTEVLARLIYRAYIQPDPLAPLEADARLPFRAALDLYARTARAEAYNLQIVSESDTIPEEESCENVSESDTIPETAPAPRQKKETGLRGLNGGKATEEKREIYARLIAFCAAHGLGARRMIAEHSCGKLTLSDVQDLTDARQRPIQNWRAAARAMERIEEGKHAEEI